MLWFLDVEIGGKRQRKVRGIAFKHIQARCDFWNKTDKQIDLLSYSLSWASPSLTRQDVRIKRPSSVSFMEVRATVDCCSSAWVLEKWDLLTMFGLRILGFKHGLSSKQSSVARTEPNNLLSSAIAYVAQRICTEALSAWFLLSDEPKTTTSTCWQHLGMKLTSVTWHWRKHTHQIHLALLSIV